MRSVVEAAGDRELDTTDGVRVVEDDGRWVLVLPDPAEATTHLGRRPDADSATVARGNGPRVEGAGPDQQLTGGASSPTRRIDVHPG